MTTFNADYYKGQFIDKPSSKIRKGKYDGTKKLFYDKVTLADAAGTAGLNAADEINLGYLPKNAHITDALVKIDKSLGATGIFTLGTRATTDIDEATLAEDPDSLVASADGGGQAVLARADLNSVGLREYGGETQVFLTCTEVMDDSVLDAVLEVFIEFVNA
jgi:hypothetical protein